MQRRHDDYQRRPEDPIIRQIAATLNHLDVSAGVYVEETKLQFLDSLMAHIQAFKENLTETRENGLSEERERNPHNRRAHQAIWNDRASEYGEQMGSVRFNNLWAPHRNDPRYDGDL